MIEAQSNTSEGSLTKSKFQNPKLFKLLLNNYICEIKFTPAIFNIFQ